MSDTREKTATAAGRRNDGPERLATGASGRLFLTVATGTFAIFAGRLVLSPLLPTIMADLDVSRSAAGIAISVMSGLVALSQYPAGRLADRLSRRTVLAGGLGLLVVGAVALVGSTWFGTFVAALAVTGVGRGLYGPAAAALISDLFVEKRGRAFGVHEAFVNAGGIAAAALAALLPAAVTWRAVFVPVGGLLTVVLLSLHRFGEEPYTVGWPGLDARETLARVVSTPGVPPILVAFGLLAFTVEGVLAFLPAALQAAGFAEWFATGAFAVFFVVGIAVNPVAGSIGDRIGHVTVTVGGALLAALGLAVTAVAATPPVAAAGVVAFAVGQTSVWPVLLAALMDALPDGDAGAGYGASSAAFVAAGSLGPAYVGVAADVESYTVAFVGLVGCLLACAAVAVSLRG